MDTSCTRKYFGGGFGCGGGGDYWEEGAVEGTEPHGCCFV